MDTTSQLQLTGPQMVVGGAVLAIFTAAASAALFGNAEQSERGFRLLNWLDNRRGESELPPAESNR
ncbi:hypothetical protein [Streptomyces californicus]|uniref:Uncharacterized protein n=1 Tax=Streptomyces californicus TaxID=67351 RepID=A0ABD7D6B4_9ACTN|nr:hypothetical protein [Streptomyces californicus]QRV39072.1 hypothetical protein I6J42_33810 [Streptomyces californicus]QRV52525.1 hypothetical protein I6J43_33830 [Streptomyces californicus]